LYFLCHSICCPARRDNTPPYALPQPRFLFIIPSIISTNYLLIVAFLTKLRPPKTNAPTLSLFLMFLVSLLQTREPAITSANPALGACNGPIGSNGTVIWGRCCPIHGEIKATG
jgi:hypothetical protein